MVNVFTCRNALSSVISIGNSTFVQNTLLSNGQLNYCSQSRDKLDVPSQRWSLHALVIRLPTHPEPIIEMEVDNLNNISNVI